MVWAEFYHQIFLKSARLSLTPKINDNLQILFQKWNLHILKLQFLMELDLARFSIIEWFLTRFEMPSARIELTVASSTPRFHILCALMLMNDLFTKQVQLMSKK